MKFPSLTHELSHRALGSPSVLTGYYFVSFSLMSSQITSSSFPECRLYFFFAGDRVLEPKRWLSLCHSVADTTLHQVPALRDKCLAQMGIQSLDMPVQLCVKGCCSAAPEFSGAHQPKRQVSMKATEPPFSLLGFPSFAEGPIFPKQLANELCNAGDVLNIHPAVT